MHYAAIAAGKVAVFTIHDIPPLRHDGYNNVFYRKIESGHDEDIADAGAKYILQNIFIHVLPRRANQRLTHASGDIQ